LRHLIRAAVIGVLALAPLCFGYGGFEVTAGFVDFKGLNRDLTVLNRLDSANGGIGGSGSFSYQGPLWWYGGHGGEHAGPVTLGGSGAFAARANQADSLGSELAALRASFEVGYPYSPVAQAWIRPTLELAGTGMVIYAHSKENGAVVGNFKGRFKQWFAVWGIGAAPGVELMGSLPLSDESYMGLFIKTSYFIPVSRSAWFGDKNPPDFDLGGFTLQIGLRFGKAFQPGGEGEQNWFDQ
jgi:hypothetical protein